MHKIATVLFLAATAVGQISPVLVSPDEAAKHLVKAPVPQYPTLAETARIAGDVILRITIDESGAASASVGGVVSGHPMLGQAALNEIPQRKYRPFEIGGKPTRVTTYTMVTFGSPYHIAEDRAAVMFDYLDDSARTAMDKGDYTTAEQQLNKA